jgi:hypothetical protein
MFAPYRKIGGFKNIGTFQKYRRIYKILALSRNIGGFTKCWRFPEI